MVKLKAGAFLTLVLGLLAGMGTAAQQALTDNRPAAALEAQGRQPHVVLAGLQKPVMTPKARTDLFGDPLPAGALLRLGTTRLRHGNGTSLAFADDGKTLLSCGTDRTIRFWDHASGRLLREQRLPQGPYDDAWAVLSPDGRLMAFHESPIAAACLWDVAANKLRHKIPNPKGESWWHKGIFSPDSKFLLTANDNTLQALDVVTGKAQLLGKGQDRFSHLDFTADGTLVTVGRAGIGFWDLANGRAKSLLKASEDILGGAVSPDGKSLALWTYHNQESDKGLRFLDPVTGKAKNGWFAPNVKGIYAARFTPDGKNILVSTKDEIVVWDPIHGRRVQILPGKATSNFIFSTDGKTVAAAGSVLYLWRLDSGKLHPAVTHEKGHVGEVIGVAFSPDARTIATASRDGTIRFWDKASGRLLRSIVVKSYLGGSLAYSPDGKHLYIGAGTSIMRFETNSGHETKRYSLYPPGEKERHGRHGLSGMHLTDDGTKLQGVSGVFDGRRIHTQLHGWDLASGKSYHSEVFFQDGFAARECFSRDGRLFFVPSGTIHDAVTGKELFRFAVEGKLLSGPVAFSADGALVAAGVWEQLQGPTIFGRKMIAVQVWELASLLPVVRLETGELAHAHFTPDGLRLVSAGRDSLKLWDLVTAKVIARRLAPGRFCGSHGPSFASFVALAPDGHTVATGQPDTTTLLWELSAPDGPVVPLSQRELEKCWSDLSGNDARRAQAALSQLIATPNQALALLRDRLRPAQALSAKTLHQLIVELDDANFQRRQAAAKRLAEYEDLAEPALRNALQRKGTSLETRRRIDTLLKDARLVRNQQTRRHLRGIRILEAIGSREAVEVLARLAQGAPEARMTREAKYALGRLTRLRVKN